MALRGERESLNIVKARLASIMRRTIVTPQKLFWWASKQPTTQTQAGASVLVALVNARRSLDLLVASFRSTTNR